MSPTTYALLCIIFFFVSIYYLYGQMVVSIVRWSKRPKFNSKGKLITPKLSASETAKCFIPLYQVAYLRRVMYRSYGPWLGICIASAVCIVLRLINLFIPIHGNVLFITILLMYLGILLHIILYAIPTAAVVKMYGYSIPMVILSAIIPHFMAFFLKGGISARMMALKKEEVFKADNGNTHIQSRPNKRPL